MSGHSKFANIKHKKEKNDAAKKKFISAALRRLRARADVSLDGGVRGAVHAAGDHGRRRLPLLRIDPAHQGGNDSRQFRGTAVLGSFGG